MPIKLKSQRLPGLKESMGKSGWMTGFGDLNANSCYWRQAMTVSRFYGQFSFSQARRLADRIYFGSYVSSVSGDSMRRILLSLSLLSIISAASAAGNNMRPGLWEVTTTSMLLALVPQIPPDQMQKLTSLAKQYGLDMPKVQNGAATSKVCITQQMADQEIPPYFHHNQTGCSIKNVIRTENSYKMDLVCTDSQFKGNGRTEGTFITPESFSGWTTFNGTIQNNPVNDHADTSGRWINASCETLKSAH